MEAESDVKKEQQAPADEEHSKSEVAKDFFVSESDATAAVSAATNPDDDEADDAQSALKVLPEEHEQVKGGHFEDEQTVHAAALDKSDDSSAQADDKRKVDWPEKAAALKNFVKERGIVVSKALRRLSGKREDFEHAEDGEAGKTSSDSGDKTIWSSLSFMKPSLPSEHATMAPATEAASGFEKFKGRVMLFSKSGCPDSRAARSLLREKRLPFVEVNLDVFKQQSLELEERTGTSSVPQVFFNDQLIGGIDELNELLKSGELDQKIKEVAENECPPSAPTYPLYGEDEAENPAADEFAEVVEKLREKVQVKDRFLKLRLFSKAFVGADAVEFLAEDQYCERDEAVEYGRKLAKKHFFHHVQNEHDFEDGNNLYRFYEHDPVVFRCLNFSGAPNDLEPMPAADIATKLRKLIHAIYERYISEDGRRVSYYAIAVSEEFRRYAKLTEGLHRVDVLTLSREEKLAFFINIYNAMVVHAIIQYGRPDGPLERRKFFGDVQYVIGGYPYSLSAIENGILRANQRPPYAITKPFGAKDPRLQVALKEPEPLIHFSLCYGTMSSPAVRCYTPEGVDSELRVAAREFLETEASIDTEARTVWLNKTFKWYSVDFGKNEREVLQWIAKHIDPTKAEHLLSLLEDGSPVKVNYRPHEWAINTK